VNAPSHDIKDLLAAASSLALTFGTDLFVSEMPTTPDQCVCIYDTGGFDPEANFRYDRPTTQVRVRGDKGELVAAYALMEDIRNVLHGTTNETVNSTRYIAIWQQGDIFNLPHDDNHRPILTANFRMHRTNA